MSFPCLDLANFFTKSLNAYCLLLTMNKLYTYSSLETGSFARRSVAQIPDAILNDPELQEAVKQVCNLDFFYICLFIFYIFNT